LKKRKGGRNCGNAIWNITKRIKKNCGNGIGNIHNGQR